MHMQPVFRNEVSFVNGISEYLFENGLCLPSGSSLTSEDKLRIAEVFQKFFKKNNFQSKMNITKVRELALKDAL